VPRPIRLPNTLLGWLCVCVPVKLDELVPVVWFPNEPVQTLQVLGAVVRTQLPLVIGIVIRVLECGPVEATHCVADVIPGAGRAGPGVHEAAVQRQVVANLGVGVEGVIRSA
jgi:hypothetical protein